MGIESKYKYKGQTQERQGVSFKIGNFCFKGSQVDRKFSLAGLEKSLALKQEQHLKHEQEQLINSQFERTRQKISRQRFNTASTVAQSNHDVADKNLAGELAKGLGKAIEISMTPQENHEHAAFELLQEQRRRKKKSRKVRR